MAKPVKVPVAGTGECSDDAEDARFPGGMKRVLALVHIDGPEAFAATNIVHAVHQAIVPRVRGISLCVPIMELRETI